MNPKVSVCITTYNHDSYIEQCLESVLMQRTDFQYEILIGEDQSDDCTREIVKGYAVKYPDKVRLFLHDHPPDHVRINGRKNFIYNLRKARGKYVALLDGDDFWLDRDKIQKQVNFLDRNPGFSICFHDVLCKSDEGFGTSRVMPGLKNRDIFSLEDLLLGNFIFTCSVVFRISGLKIPGWYHSTPTGDWPLYLMLAKLGSIGYIHEIMGVYREHAGGIWTSKDNLSKRTSSIKMLKTIDAYFRYEYHDKILISINTFFIRMLNELIILNDLVSYTAFLQKHLNKDNFMIIFNNHIKIHLKLIVEDLVARELIIRLGKKLAKKSAVQIAESFLNENDYAGCMEFLEGSQKRTLSLDEQYKFHLFYHFALRGIGVEDRRVQYHAIKALFFQKKVSLDPEIANYRSASLKFGLGRLRSSEREFLVIVKSSLRKNLIAGSLYYLGLIAKKYSLMQRSREFFFRCLQMNPDHVEARCQLDDMERAGRENRSRKQ